MTELKGRELDRAVAKAQGWTQVPYHLRPQGSDRMGWTKPGGMYGGRYDVPCYSTDWGAAGPLLEEMAASGDYSFDMETGVKLWSILASPNRQDKYWFVSGGSGPEAIARALVAWKGGR